MTTLQEIALEIYGRTDFTDDLGPRGDLAGIANICVDLAKEFLKATRDEETKD